MTRDPLSPLIDMRERTIDPPQHWRCSRARRWLVEFAALLLVGLLAWGVLVLSGVD